MSTLKEKEDFLMQFLDGYGAKQLFIHNFEDQNNKFASIQDLIEFAEEHTISDAFIWYKTLEAHDFWSKISMAWAALYEEKFK